MKKSSSIAGKIVFMSAIIGALLLANLFIGLKLDDREVSRNVARNSIYEAAGGKFNIAKVEFSVPYVRSYTRTNSKGEKYIDKEYGTKDFEPEILNCDADIKTEMRKIGIYSSPVFTAKIKLDGQFNFSFKNNSEYTYSFYNAKCRVVLTDKSVLEIPTFVLNGIKTDVEFENNEQYLANNGMYEFPEKSILKSTFKCNEGLNTFSAELNVRGADSFSIWTSGKQTKLSVKSDWKSPGFTGFDYLPTTKNLTDEGFTADWHVPFGSNLKDSIGFEFITPVDVYKMLDRAVTYGFLFIIVPFIVLFLFEIFMKISLHPVNYLLCGAASIVFFLLLMSFSEHIPFIAAYLISSFASGIVISLYVASITKNVKTGIGMCVTFILMYGYLFFSLKSEDYALLIGSIFTFIIIAALMFFTRKVDWNNLKGASSKAEDDKSDNLKLTDKTE